MRVAVVAAGPRDRLNSDAADRLDWLATALDRRGHDVVQLGPAWWPERDANVDRDGVQFRALTPEPEPPVRRLAAFLPATVREVDPDIIHMNHAEPLVVAAAAAAATALRVPFAVDWYDLNAATGWGERVRQLTARAPDLAVAPSRLVQTGLREMGRPESGVPVIPTPIDMEVIQAVEPEPLADLIYSRRLDEGANLESLLLSLAELRELDWEAAVVGDGPARDGYETQAEELRIDDRVQFLGDQPLGRRLGLFRGAHAYAHTALEAPFATDLLRALACGCVGIVEYHANSAAHELIEQRDRGLRVTDEEELADAIREAAEMDHLTTDDTYAGFDVEPVLDRYIEAYQDLRVDRWFGSG